jgi:hypothetical protein
MLGDKIAAPLGAPTDHSHQTGTLHRRNRLRMHACNHPRAYDSKSEISLSHPSNKSTLSAHVEPKPSH